MITTKKNEQGLMVATCDCGQEIEHEVGERNGEKMCLVCFFSDRKGFSLRDENGVLTERSANGNMGREEGI